ncbi:hypothetical protein BS47DRAFT_1370062 [Hydnum rufescens UP504]|uniref:Uncharacterized protein n=1 Tax=Hydnum rufescens UP504 TaxID=1448309 RepID=A0A9P6ABK2_9AGAM|nr:hypothetical protein BS47DRAFT_1370062 [Hydnum rufescens UP504]
MYWRDGALPLQGLQATQSVQRSAVIQSMLIKDQLIGPRAPGMRPSMDPLKAGHSLVLPSGEKSTLSLSATVLSATMLSMTVLSETVLSETVLSETVLSAIALLPHSSLVLLVFSIPPALVQGHLFDIHSPPLVPHVFPAWVLAVLWVLLAVVHGLVIITHTLLAIICHLSITRILMNVACILVVAPLLLTVPCVLLLCDRHSGDRLPSLGPPSPHVPPPDWDFPSVQGLHHDRPEPENAMLEDQAPEAQTTDDNGQPGTESNETAEASPVNLDPPVFVGDWFCIEFSSSTGDVNIREVFEHLSEDHLFGVHVRKNKGGKGLARLKKKVMLAFKSQPATDAVLSRFRNSLDLGCLTSEGQPKLQWRPGVHCFLSMDEVKYPQLHVRSSGIHHSMVLATLTRNMMLYGPLEDDSLDEWQKPLWLQAIKPYGIPDPPVHAVWKPLDSSTPKSGSLNGTHPLHTPPSF